MNIFITGGTTGIGLELVKLYLAEGHNVGLCGRDLDKLPDDFIQKHDNLFVFETDVTNNTILQETVKKFVYTVNGKLDLLIANAGISIFNKQSIPDFNIAKQIINTNVIGVLNSFEAAMQWMLPENKGHLVAIASVAGMIGLPGAAAYSASKAAVLKLCESHAIDLKKHGINVTAIAPGFIDTPLTRKNNHATPFIMDASKAATKIKKAIEKKKYLYIFPFTMKIIIYILEKMPRRIYRRLMQLVS